MRIAKAVGAAAVVGAAVAGWSVRETRQFGVTSLTVPVLPTGLGTLRVLHLSDLHLTTGQGAKQRWLAGLWEETQPDVTVVTGDFLADFDAVPTVLETLGDLLRHPGVFVLGSNDYYAPRIVNPFGYLLRPSELKIQRPEMPWGDLVSGLREAGWADLSNAATTMRLGDEQLEVAFRGVDDPHIDRDRYQSVAGPYPEQAQLRIGVTHSPYLRTLDALVADGTDLVLAGHTHGGQVCLPGGRAIVTNCDLDPARASGLSTHDVGQVRASPLASGSWLHVSPGIGTAPSAPFRLFCPPRATLLELTAIN